jgi:hypothetical protein
MVSGVKLLYPFLETLVIAAFPIIIVILLYEGVRKPHPVNYPC